ncbi:MAG TPA: guanosine-3',5'-bis(diphosphate) 3'-diphosphatase, partial [Methylophaga sp.]|nr:guanosine-3',5'-bis(diphosphate) 3'-diphosphatase [Methylophaga sp.]
SLEELDESALKRAFKELDVSSEDALLESLGMGNRMTHVVARRLVAAAHGESYEHPVGGEGSKAVMISGSEGMVINFARCCHPLPGDPVVGHLSTGKGLVVHRAECKNVVDKNFADKNDPDKLFALEWSDTIDEDFPVALRIEIESRRGLVAELAGLVTDADANIERIGIEERDAHLSTVNLTLSVKGRVHLARIIKRIRNLPNVGKITRLAN